MRALIVAALLLASTLAFGTAEAKPGEPQCVHGGIEVPIGPVTLRTHCGRAPTVDVDECWPRQC